jgi:hypothetical protein
MQVDRDYIFTLYQMNAGTIYRYLQQIEHRVEDAEARPARSQHVQVTRLANELASIKLTLSGKLQQMIQERQLNHQVLSCGACRANLFNQNPDFRILWQRPSVILRPAL